MKLSDALFSIVLAAGLHGCGGIATSAASIQAPTTPAPSPTPTPTPSTSTTCTLPTPVTTDVNVMLLTVNGSTCAAGSYLNKPCVDVTICIPGSSTCQTLTDILLDTGSTGLRVFKSALNAPIAAGLTPVTKSGHPVANCAQYADSSSQWGAVQTADIVLGNEPKVQTSIEVIDASFGTTHSNVICPGSATASGTNDWPDNSPAEAGLNGILGLGLFANDCGSSCATDSSNGIYFTCNAGSCSGATMAVAKQLGNPATLFPVDNNGIIMELPSVGVTGTASVDGFLVFGIATRTNNLTCTAKAYPADPNTGEFITKFNGHTDSTSYIDSGSNSLAFPTPGSSTLPDCGTTNSSYAGYFCASSQVNFTATNKGYLSTPSMDLSFSIGHAITILNSGNNVFPNLGDDSGDTTTFDWGLPFFLGRNVYVGFEGKSSALGSGMYWAY